MIEKTKILITAYKNPDLDGTACAFAYAEFLQKTGRKAIAGIFGIPHKEADFVMKKFNILSPENAEKIIADIDEIIIVDASDLRGISSEIDPQKIIEIIDHRKVNEADKFPNAKVQIELVGSAATLIAEKFFENQTAISKESAALLFSAIISNTINFQAKVTTDRDREMADWLKTKFSLPANYVQEMFADKSRFNKPLKEIFFDDFATFSFAEYHLGIVQLELINVDEFVQKNLKEIKEILEEFKKEKNLDFIFLTCVDLEKAFNEIVAIDRETEKVLEKTLDIEFENGIARRNGILMRKEIVPLVKEKL